MKDTAIQQNIPQNAQIFGEWSKGANVEKEDDFSFVLVKGTDYENVITIDTNGADGYVISESCLTLSESEKEQVFNMVLEKINEADSSWTEFSEGYPESNINYN